MSGYKTRLDPALENELAITPTDRLFDMNLFDLGTPDTSFAYSVAKGVQLRVAAASLAWGRQGARVNSLSPGIICTPTPLGRTGDERGRTSPASRLSDATRYLQALGVAR
jgi:NAD(P)-dependent dehydrogenase (short-subunit alcohol dehydrogenase family)